jgi:hypothetical protein
MVLNWSKIGVIIQGSSIDGGTFNPASYMEVESQLDDSGDTVVPWPNNLSLPPLLPGPVIINDEPVDRS